MSLQEVFYLVAIIFMSVSLVILIIFAVMTFDVLGKIKRIAIKVDDFTDSATESGRRIMDKTEEAIPRIIEALSIGQIIKKAVQKWEKK